MIDNLRDEQIKLEKKSRGVTIDRFHKVHTNSALKGNYSETKVGTYVIDTLLETYTNSITEFLKVSLEGKVGRSSRSATLLSQIEPEVSAFLFLKAVINKVPMYHLNKPCTLTGLAIYGAGLIHDELRIRYFQQHWRPLAKKLFKDFSDRELPRHKRKELIRRQFNNLEIEWATWSKEQMVHVGIKLTELLKDNTGVITITEQRHGKYPVKTVEPTPEFAELLARRVAATEGLYSTYYPMVVPPIDWDDSTLNRGGYLTNNVSKYPLVKASRLDYRESLRVEDMPEVIAATNALQRTPWRVNETMLDILQTVYTWDKEIAGLPPSSITPIPHIPDNLAADDFTSDVSKEYRKQCYLIHESNRRNVSKRVATLRIFDLARQFAKYDALYFPHDLDSRSRAYPKPALLNPQGPDYSKAILEFAEGKPLMTEEDACWLAYHGANSWGFDKGTRQERVDWIVANDEMITSIAKNPLSDLRWTTCDAPAQFLAFCLEWEEFCEVGYGFMSHLPVAVDATCSGLQHFSGMLRDPECGEAVNMTPSIKRQDVYQRTADVCEEAFKKDTTITRQLSQSWLGFRMTRATTKRSVMIVPYAGTFHACMRYVEAAVLKRVKEGEVVPWHGPLNEFVTHGAKMLWPSIAKTVPAATVAMEWLSKIAKAVGKSQPEGRYVKWVTPVGFPVRQYKFKQLTRRIETALDGKRFQAAIRTEKPELDPRQLGTCIPPSFVHSLDAAHMHKTIAKASSEGMEHFAAVHDSFAVHATDIPRFNAIIRETFVEMYEEHDVLQEFIDSNIDSISDKYLDSFPDKPPMGTLDIHGVLESDYFFS